MTRTKSTKKALIASVLSLLLCCSMLLGTTFAWFTDSVTSSNNIIKSGDLDIVLEYYDAEAKKWKDVTDSKDILTGDLWEPGYVDVAYLRLKNDGTLALKYALAVNVVSETEGVNKDGKSFKLSDYIYFDVEENVDGQTNGFATRADAMAVATQPKKISEGYTKFGNLSAGSEFVYLAMVVYMPTTVGNEANHDGEHVPQIDLGINVFATQDTVESDSFNNQYDAYTAVFTVANANAMLAENKDVALVNCIEPKGVLCVPAGYTGTLTLHNVTIASVQEAAAVETASTEEAAAPATKATNIVILGNVVIKATENGMSAITGTALNISGNGNLTAIAKGDLAYGIGGNGTKEITVKDVHIVDIRGGHVQPNFINDTSWGKTEPTGGAAIGSGYSGAVITLDGVTIDNAQGGSKAAGIGARYWTGVTININNSIINNVEGGNASAGIGGSRVSDEIKPADQHVKINITNSSINATGGQFGAGIGSGYDTHCGEKDGKSHITETICTINIDEKSQITAQGGKYAAGVGTGYHVAALAGEIKCQVNATSGGSREKYTVAQDVGFGVVDHGREVKYLSTAPSITYNGTVITVPDAQITTQDALTDAIKAGKTEIALAAGEYTMPSTSSNVTISGTKDTKINLPYNQVSGSGNEIVFDGVTIMGETNSSWHSTLFNGATKVVYKNCEIYNQLTAYCDSEFVNCNFYNTFDNDYSVYCYYGKEIKFDGCSFDTKCSKAIKVYDEGNGGRSVYVNNCSFTTETANKAAVEIDSRFSTYHIYFTGTNTLSGAYIKLWNSDAGEDQGTNVYIDGVLQARPTVVTPDNVNSVDFTKDGIYNFSGDFGGNNILVQSVAGKNIVLDGTNATNIGELVVNANETILDNETDMLTEDKREGSYAIENFNAKQITAYAYNTSLEIASNKVEFLYVYGGNLALNINANEVDANFTSHSYSYPEAIKRTRGTNEYAVYLEICDYFLNFDNNTATDAYSHAVGINGYQTPWKVDSTAGKTNNIASFSGNNITVNSTEKTERAALKIWDDTIYAPNTSSTAKVDAAVELQNTIKASNNTFTLGEGHIFLQFDKVSVSTL